MKKRAFMALSLIIVMMCVSPAEAMGQSRRSSTNANAATKSEAPSSSRRSTNISRESASRKSTPKANDNVAPKSSERKAAPKVNEGGRNAAPKMNGNDRPPMAKNNPPKAHNNPPKIHHNPPRNPEPPRHAPAPRPPRPPRGSHYHPSVLGTALTLARINLYYDAIRRAENAARLATRYSVVINRNYTPRTYADIVTTVNDHASYYYNDGVFYVLGADGEYYVIEPPIGALVDAIPADCERVVIDGEVYYEVDRTLYMVTIIEGVPYFEVVANL